MFRRSSLLIAVGVCTIVGTGCAHTPRLSELEPATRIRIWHNNRACCESPLIGTLVSYDPDTLHIRVPTRAEPLALSRASIQEIESARMVARGERGSLIGLALGLIAGGIIGYSTSCSHCDGDWRGFGMIMGGIEGLIVGPIAGALAGLGFRREVWDPVSR